MAKALERWTVLPHRSLERLSPAVMTVTGDMQMPLTGLERRMTVVRLRTGRLVIYSAIALAEPEMRELEAFGEPGFLVVPSRLHRYDAFIWKQRYPQLVVVAPSGARTRVEEVVQVDTSSPAFEDDAVSFVEVQGTAGEEGALEVNEGEQLTLVLNDVVGNLPKNAGVVLRALGFATEKPRVPRMIKRALVHDVGALRSQFEAWASRPVARILVSHGTPIVEGAREALAEMARSL
jgi:hypothetical protein